jgi:hypothetical protein
MATVYLHPAMMNLTQAAVTTSIGQDATTDMFGWVFQAEEDVTVTQVAINFAIKTGSPGTLRVGFQGVNTSDGLNDGTWQSYVDVAMSGITFGQFTFVTLDTTQTLTRGQLIAIVGQPISGTWDASNKITVTLGMGNGFPFQSLPYAINNLTGTTSKNTTISYWNIGYRSSTKTYGWPFRVEANNSYNSTTSPDETGMRFTLPAKWGKKFTLLGLHANHRFIDGGGGTFNMNLYDANTTLITQKAFDTDQVYVPTTGTNRESTYLFYFTDSTLTELSYGTTYIIAFEYTNAVNSNPYRLRTDGVATDFSAITDGTLEYVTRKDTGAWTTTTTQVPCWQLIIRDTSGGFIGHPGMSGGMRG